MIYIDIKDMEFYDDAVSFVRSFYPRTEVARWDANITIQEEDIIIRVDTPETAGRLKKDFHEEFKRNLYQMLVEKTGKTLPWGDLSGVRPSKNAYLLLEDNETEQDILDMFTKKHFVSEAKAQLALQVAKTEKQILDTMDYKNGYSIYIGIPFCPTTCLYCSFTSYSLAGYKHMVDDYLTALEKEMACVSELMKGSRLDTIYFGGGTPTTLDATQLDRILTSLKRYFDVEHAIELTVEAGRPDSITREKLEVLKRHGVGRISINPQTMNQETLDIIGRRHTVEQIKEAFAMAREVGFDNINMDMILGLPGEDKQMVAHTLKEIQVLAPESLTVHSLAIKRAAALNVWREKYLDLQIENSEEIVDMAADCAKSLGYQPYYMYRQKNMVGNFENVGYSLPGKECIYNILIMEEKQTIIAMGAGASSKIVFHEETNDNHAVRIERIENVKDVKNYIERIDEMIERKKKFFENI